MTSLERTACEILAVLLLIGGFALWERHKGATACINADKAAVAEQEAHNADVLKTDAQTLNQEAIDHAKALAAAPDPTPILHCVQYITPRAVPKAAAPEPTGHAAPDLPAAVGPSFDPAPAVAKVGQAADAQVAELQDYIKKVCLAH
jgi:hypothetical protein